MEVGNRTVAQMPGSRRAKTCTRGGPRRDLWRPFGRTIVSFQNPKVGILLVDLLSRCPLLCEEVQAMPAVQHCPKQPLEYMASILSPILFDMWAVDTVEILPTSTK